MRIRHLTAAVNVDAEGYLLDPGQVRHGIVVGGKIAGLAGLVDPLSHLNLDFPAHRLDDCLVAEGLEVGAPLRWEGDHFRVAQARPSAYSARGALSQEAARIAWQARLAGQTPPPEPGQ